MKERIKNYIKGRVAFRCKTLEQIQMLSIYLNDLEYTWCNGRTYLQDYHFDYKENTCYYPHDGTFCDLDYFISNGYDVINFEDVDTRFKDDKFIPNFKIQEITCTN
jgi:hypothetical protein